MHAHSHQAVNPALVLGKATGRAAEMLGLSGAALGKVVGLSAPSVSRILHGDKGIDPSSKEGELALLLIRVYRSLDALVGNDKAMLSAWMGAHHHALAGVPRQLILNVEGLVRTLNYLDGMRAPA